MTTSAPVARRVNRCFNVLMAAALCGCALTIRADYAADGQGLEPVLSGVLPNAALSLQTRHTWINAATPDKPCRLETEFTLPPCEAIPVARLFLTVWGGTANSICQLDVRRLRLAD